MEIIYSPSFKQLSYPFHLPTLLAYRVAHNPCGHRRLSSTSVRADQPWPSVPRRRIQYFGQRHPADWTMLSTRVSPKCIALSSVRAASTPSRPCAPVSARVTRCCAATATVRRFWIRLRAAKYLISKTRCQPTGRNKRRVRLDRSPTHRRRPVPPASTCHPGRARPLRRSYGESGA